MTKEEPRGWIVPKYDGKTILKMVRMRSKMYSYRQIAKALNIKFPATVKWQVDQYHKKNKNTDHLVTKP